MTAFLPLMASADVYETAFFSMQISSLTGSLNGLGVSLGDTISGRFVFDLQMIPAAGSGLQSVPFSAIPNVDSIPKPIAFDMSFGSLHLDLGNLVAGSGAIQYNNGLFAGFDVEFDFAVQGTEYRFEERGNQFDIERLLNGQPTGDILVSGTIDLGENSLSNIQPFELTSLPGNGLGDSLGGSNGSPPGSGLPPGNDPPMSDPPSVPEPCMFWAIVVVVLSLWAWERVRRSAQEATR